LKQQLLLGLFSCIAVTALAQTSIFGGLSLHHDAQLAFFDAPVHFVEGNIAAAEANDAFVVFSAAQPLSANDNSHVETPILSRDHTDFVFPTGDNGVYQPLTIKNGDDNDLMVLFQGVAYEDLLLPEGVDFISSQFHWLVSGEKTAQLGLSWNTNSLLSQVADEVEELVILGHTAAGWEVIPAQLAPFAADGITPTSLDEGAIFSDGNIPFSRYDALTIGGVKSVTTVLVSEGLTPNGDNVNDTWYIENIERYPEAVIRVFNRWGGEVFYHRGNYKNDWNGTYKNNLETLPEAPYYYRIDLDNDGYIEHQGWIYINY
jgi:gliding motility-associated-like protein